MPLEIIKSWLSLQINDFAQCDQTLHFCELKTPASVFWLYASAIFWVEKGRRKQGDWRYICLPSQKSCCVAGNQSRLPCRQNWSQFRSWIQACLLSKVSQSYQGSGRGQEGGIHMTETICQGPPIWMQLLWELFVYSGSLSWLVIQFLAEHSCSGCSRLTKQLNFNGFLRMHLWNWSSRGEVGGELLTVLQFLTFPGGNEIIATGQTKWPPESSNYGIPHTF